MANKINYMELTRNRSEKKENNNNDLQALQRTHGTSQHNGNYSFYLCLHSPFQSYLRHFNGFFQWVL